MDILDELIAIRNYVGRMLDNDEYGKDDLYEIFLWIERILEGH